MSILITGGLGFIGCNAASRFIGRGEEVLVLDNFSRPGSLQNMEWLRSQGPVTVLGADIRDAARIRDVFRQHRDVTLVLHLAAQVAVTSSVVDPRTDFEVNALGTLNVLEAMRVSGVEAPLIYSSTNKVYGQMEDLEIVDTGGRYAYKTLTSGVPETRPLDFHSPYGCSKGAAEQYVRDYHRIFGLKTVVFRQSCIYGYRQFGVEDQGWVAWFMIAAAMKRPLTIYGDGKQVRDVLFIEDLIDAFEAVASNSSLANGAIYNMGGSSRNTLSLIELLSYIEERTGAPVDYSLAPWRPGDQLVYVSDTAKAEHELNWKPRIRCDKGLQLLYDWVTENKHEFEDAPSKIAAVA
jgi:CDP-paratose 2-epimerase